MVNQKAKRAFKAVAVLFALVLVAALVLSLVLSSGSAMPGAKGSVVLSEVMASNRAYAAPNGQYLDYIELRNLTDSPVDISGYMLSDRADAIGYTFPFGTQIPAGGYIVCWCDPDDTSGAYAAFGISRDGTDEVYLYNTANVVVDRLEVPFSEPNIPLVRLDDGTWQTGSFGTPGYANTQAGYDAWLAAQSAEEGAVVISEVLPGSHIRAMDATGTVCDWVELYNPGPAAVTLSGAWLSDDPQEPAKSQLPQIVLAPGQRQVIPCGGAGGAAFSLSREGCTVLLSGGRGQRLSRLEVPALGRDISWCLQADGTYAQSEYPTPGFENTQAGYDAWLQTLERELLSVVISEVMSVNGSAVLSQKGTFCDWVELCNTGDSSLTLSGAWLSAGADEPAWQLPQLTLAPGERKVIACAGTQAGEGEATFTLPKEGCVLTLSDPMGLPLSRVEVPAMERDRSYALQADGTWAVTHLATPGHANTEKGRQTWLQSQKPLGSLAISEVMPSNGSFYRQSDGEYYDWVELRNVSGRALQLSDYYLSDDASDPQRFRLPEKKLEPGQRVIVILTDGAELTCDCIHGNFGLSRAESWLYVSDAEGFVDRMHIYDVPYRGSVGRMPDTYAPVYFDTPTPGSENGTGIAFLSENPAFETEAGVYNDVEAVEVTLSGSHIRYTTDGSQPRQDSPAYTGPISVDKTCVIRAASFAPGKHPSDTVTAAFIINENHTLPVISLATEPAELFGGNGLYVNYTTEREVPCNVSLFEENGGFNMDCGLKMFGHMGLTLPKKSFKINFRGAYGADYLTYPVYGEDGPRVYDSLVIRAGQDYPNTVFRDELFTSLCREASDSVLAQRDKFCILYINGSYWGIYCMKEAFGQTMYAENNRVDDASVEVLQAPVMVETPMFDLISYCRKNDLSDPEKYAYFESQMNVDSLIDWMIFEGYTANTDVQQNLRYFRSSQVDGKWQFAFYDLDWAWYFKNGFINMWSPERTWQHMPLCVAPMKNPQFRAKFFARAAQLRETVLSDAHVLDKIDEYAQLLRPEIAREKARWGGSLAGWEQNVANMKAYLTERDHWGHLIGHMQRFVGLTDEEYATYFGGAAR